MMELCLGKSSEVCLLVVCKSAATGDDKIEFVRSFVDLRKK